MSQSLKTVIRQQIETPTTAALVAETEFVPISGIGTPVAPPSYAKRDGDNSSGINYAFTEEAFVPTSIESSTAEGWHLDIARDESGAPRLAPRVVLDSVGAEAGRDETALWKNQNRLGVSLPGIVITKPSQELVDSVVSKVLGAKKTPMTVPIDFFKSQINQALDLEVSTWELAHRQCDAWVRYAANPKGGQVWDGGEVKDLITAASVANADVLYQHFVNAAIYGFWLSSGVTQRNKLPRAYSSEIAGFGAYPVHSAATKLDAMGGANKVSRLIVGSTGLISGANKAKGGKPPSELGFGQIPSHPQIKGFVCEQILQSSSVSLPVLRSLRFSNDEEGRKSIAASTVLVLLAIVGRMLSAEDGFLRSGCSLAVEADRWGWRSSDPAISTPVIPLYLTDIDVVIDALQEAIADAETVGLQFAKPIELSLSEVQTEIIVERVFIEGEKSSKDGES